MERAETAESTLPAWHDAFTAEAGVKAESQATLRRSDLVRQPAVGAVAPSSVSLSIVEACDDDLSRARTARRRLARAWSAVLSFDIEQGQALTLSAERGLGGGGAPGSRILRDEIAALRAASLAIRDEGFAALLAVRTIMESRSSGIAARIAFTIARLGYWKLGDLDRVLTFGRPSARAEDGGQHVLLTILDLTLDAAVEADLLRYPAALRLATDALAMAEDRFGRGASVAALPASVIAQILYDGGYLDEAESVLTPRLEAIRQASYVDCALRAFPTLARIASHRGQVEFAALILQEAEALGERRGWVRLVAASLLERLHILARRGRLREARVCVDRLDRLAAHTQPDAFVQSEVRRLAAMGRCRFMIAAGLHESAPVLRQLHAEAIARRDLSLAFRLQLELAEALENDGRVDEALQILMEVLRTASGAGLYQAFRDGGPGMDRLLRRLRDQPGALAEPYLPYLVSLGRTPSQGLSKQPARTGVRSCSNISDRERAILRLIAQGYSNKRIAQSLTISPETVKSHAKHIFAKLAAGNRAEAVSKAEGLGLI